MHVQLRELLITSCGEAISVENKIESYQCLGAMDFFQTLFTLKERAFVNSLCFIRATKDVSQTKKMQEIFRYFQISRYNMQYGQMGRSMGQHQKQ